MKYIKKRKSTLFYKYLFSYLIIFLIPFTTISIIFYHMSINNIKEEIINSNMAQLEQVRDLTDERLSELRDIATRISFDHRLTPYKLNQPYFSKEGINELITYQANSSMIDTLVLTYHENDLLYTSKGTSSIDNLIEHIYPISEHEREAFQTQLENITEPTFQAVALDKNGNQEIDRSVLTYIYPIPPHSTSHYGAVVFFIKEQKIKQLIANILGDFKGNSYVYNKTNDIIVSNNVGEPLPSEVIDRYVLAHSGVTSGEVDGEEYSFVTVHSAESDWTFVTAMPTEQFYSKMSAMKMTISVMLFIIAILGVGITVYLSLKQYRPIQKLIQSIRKHQEHVEAAPVIKQRNELDRIRETIEFIFDNSDELQQKVDRQQPFVREQLLLRLLKENVTMDEKMKKILSELKITFNGKHFFVIMIAFNERVSEESLDHREKILQMLQEVVYKDCIGYGIELFNENAAVLIVNMKRPSDDERRHFAKELTEHLSGYFKVMPTIGVGKISSGLEQINRSFIEASAAVDYHLMNHEKDLIYFEDVTETGDHHWYSPENHVQLTQSLKQGDRVVAREALQNIIKHLKEQNTSIHLLKCMCFDVINTVLKTHSELGLLTDVKKMNDVTEFHSLEELEVKIGRFIDEICQQVEMKKESHNDELRNHILLYLQKEFNNHHLSLATTAEKFELSASYLSRFIKEQTGATFTQYVWELRVEAFKEKLITTNAPIKDIVTEVGYVDVANFTRKFRKTEGITPGEYRKRYQMIQGSSENVL